MLTIGGKEHESGKNSNKSQHALLGNVEVPQNSRLEDLKMHIMTLPALSKICVPSPKFVRLRKLEGGRLTRVLTGQQTLR